jgi:ankyrin repeat protein
LDSGQFRNWVDQSNQTLFCPGIPGAGKTMSASIAVDELYAEFQNDASVGIAYIYCNFRRQQEQRPVDLIASLLKQLIQGLPSVPQAIQRLYEHYQHKRTRPSLDEISQALQSVVANYSKTFIVIDALDECQVSDGGRKRFLAELFNLQAKTATNLFVTSRFIPEIEKEFDGKSMPLEIRASDHDLHKYLDGHMLKLPSFVSRSAELQKEAKSAIIEAVDGMYVSSTLSERTTTANTTRFLLAQLHLDSLIGKRSPKAIKLALKELPTGSGAYDYAYKETMERIEGQVADSQELAKLVLSWITCAKRPLSTLELRHALAVEVGKSELDEENLPEIEDIVSVCAGLVTVDKEGDIVRLVHYTTQEYFERTQRDWFPDGETNIAKTCVTYLSFDAFEAGFCPTDKEFDVRLQLNPLYDYAAGNWGYHVRTASQEAEQFILDFLDNEAKMSACSQVMLDVQRYPGSSQRVPRQITGVHLTACFGLTQMTTTLLKNGYQSDCKNTYGQTPLSWAAERGHEAIVELLVVRDDVDADSKDSNDRTPLWWAIVKGHEPVVKLLINRVDVDANSKDVYGWTPLLKAVEYGNEAVVKLLVDRDDVDADSKNEHGRTPLSLAAMMGHDAVVKLLMIRDDVDADSKDRDGRTPLWWATVDGHKAVVKLLVDRDDVGADSKNKDGKTPLCRAAEGGHEAVVRLLVDRDDVDADSKDSHGQSPLWQAAIHGHEAVVKLLVDRADVDADSKNLYGRTPLSRAAVMGHEAVVKLLVNRDDVDADSKDRDGRTPLSWAAVNKHEVVVKLLVNRDDVDADSKDRDDRTPLSWAAAYGREIAVKLLMDRADVEADSRDRNGRTPLSLAAWKGHEVVVKLLLVNNGICPDSKDNNGRTPLSWAAGMKFEEILVKNSKHQEVVGLLLANNSVDVNSKDNNGRTPLSWAADWVYQNQNLLWFGVTDEERTEAHGTLEAVVKLLLAKNKVDPNSTDSNGKTPLSYAKARGNKAVIKLLTATA